MAVVPKPKQYRPKRIGLIVFGCVNNTKTVHSKKIGIIT